MCGGIKKKDIQRLADTERTRWKPNKTGSLHKLTKRQRPQSQRVKLRRGRCGSCGSKMSRNKKLATC